MILSLLLVQTLVEHSTFSQFILHNSISWCFARFSQNVGTRFTGGKINIEWMTVVRANSGKNAFFAFSCVSASLY